MSWEHLQHRRPALRRLVRADVVGVLLLLVAPPLRGQLVSDPAQSHLAACPELLGGEAAVASSAAASDLFSRFELEPFVFVLSESSSSRLLVSPTQAGVQSIEIPAANLGPYFGGGTLLLKDDGLGADEAAGDGVFTAEVVFAGSPGVPTGTQGLRSLSFTLHFQDGSQQASSEDVAYTYAWIPDRLGAKVEQLGPDTWVSPRAINLVRPDLLLDDYPTSLVKEKETAQAVYQSLPDIFDWVAYFGAYSSRGLSAGAFRTVSNRVEGIGKPLSDNTAEYGSAGRLRGKIDLSFKGLGSVMTHEIFHQWGVGPDFALLGLWTGHWGPLQNGSAGTIFGSPFTFRQIHDLGGALFELCQSRDPAPLPLELYLMGLAPAGEVGQYEYVADGVFEEVIDPSTLCTPSGGQSERALRFSGTEIRTLSAGVIVDTFGPRQPAYPDADSFRVALVVVTKRPLIAEEWDYLNLVAADHEGSFREALRNLALVRYPVLPLFADGFESGDLSAWSSVGGHP